MKKIIALLMALLMASCCASGLAEASRTVAVVYTGDTVDASSLSVGDTFYWTFSMSEESCMFSGQWLIDYPEEYLTPIAVSGTWSGGLAQQINASWENGSADSDKINISYNKEYQGATGNIPVGQPNNMYVRIMLSLTSFSYYGVHMGGRVARIRFRVNALPPVSATGSDSAGRFINIPIVVLDSFYYVQGSVIAPGNEYCLPHDSVNVVPGKVYMNAVNQNLHAVKFFDMDGRFAGASLAPHGGAAQAPEIAAVVNNDTGCYLFYGWDRDITNVTEDMNVFAEYLLLGDTDLNGMVEASDALLALRGNMELQTLEPRSVFAGDINRNEQMDAEDALMILRYAMELIDTLA